MDDRDQGAQYNELRDQAAQYHELRVSGRANVHAGAQYNGAQYTFNIQNLNVNNPGELNLQQLFGLPGIGQQTSPLPLEPSPYDSNNVASPSQSSESTNPEYEYSRLRRQDPVMLPNATPPYKILKSPTRNDSRYKYFLDGDGLERYIVMRQVGYMAGSNAEVRRATYEGRPGYLVLGRTLEEEQIAELRRLSREHRKQTRVDRHMTMRDGVV